MTQVLIVLWIASIGFSIYLLTQTSGDGIPPQARSARMTAIAVGFLPCLGIPLIVQFVQFGKYRNAVASQTQLDTLPQGFGTPKPPSSSFGGTGPSGPAPQPGGNPFLNPASGPNETPPRPAPPEQSSQPPTPRPPSNNPFLDP